MRIAYLLYWLDRPDSGVFRKVMGQLSQWKQSGHQVKLWLYTATGSRLEQSLRCDAQRQALEAVSNLDVFAFSSLVERLHVVSRICQETRKWNPDIIYCRKTAYHPMLTRLAADVPLLAEVNTDDVAELLLRSKARYFANRLTRRWFLRSAAGFVCVTSELASSPRFTRFSKPTAVIANGIAQRDYPMLPPASNPQPRLVFIGSPSQRWHGVDKIVRLATSFPQWDFDLIGLTAHEVPLMLATPANVTFHGYLGRSEYETIMRQADVAIGTLALHRKGMHEACPLKVREYLTYGLPTIIGYRDTDFTDDVPFLLQLGNKEANVQQSQAEIKKFIQEWQGRRVDRELVAHLDVGRKETERLGFMQSLLEPCYKLPIKV